MLLIRALQTSLGRFAPLSPKANWVVTRLLWVVTIAIIGFEYVKGRGTDTFDCVLPSLDETCNQARTITEIVATEAIGWDWMLISGLVLFAIAISFVDHMRPSFERCIARLFDRGVLRAGDQDEDALLKAFLDASRRWALVFALIVATAMVVVWASVLLQTFSYPKLALAAAQVVLGFIAGGYLGEMACYGRLGRAIDAGRVNLHLDPWHVDQAAGIKPVGEYFFFQATLATIPAAYLAIWIWIMPLWDRYDHWYLPYIGLLCLALVIQALAVLLPLGGFHIEMMQQKRAWQRKLDEEFRDNAKARNAMLDGANLDGQGDLEATLAHLSKRYAEIEAMPTWPVDRRLWQKFTFRNLFLLSPVLFDSAVGAVNWRTLLAAFQGI
ncbi:MAG: hypothetical protein AAFP98_08305 [Pseudomonadota bacterium]